MKKFISFTAAAMAIFMCSCASVQNKTSGDAVNQTITVEAQTDVAFTVLENFFLKNTLVLSDNVNVLTATNSDTFNSLFGAAKTMTNKIVTPDFSANSIVGIAGQATNTATAITVERITSSKEGINVFVNIKKGEVQSFSTTPTVVISLPKQVKETAVNVFAGERKIASGKF